jgi:hypothetical protein
MYRNIRFGTSLVLLLFTVFAASFSAEAKDSCAKQGIIVRNSTMLDLWYKKKGGACSIWIHEHILTIKPEDKIEIFSDLNCGKKYCDINPTYDDYKSADTDENCGVKIFPFCTISDM